MKRSTYIWLISFGVFGIISFYVGGVFGFYTGFAESIGDTSPSEAFILSQSLQRLHDNNIESASELLESQLDGKILEHYTTVSRGRRSIFNILHLTANINNENSDSFKLMKQVATYREKTKSKTEDPEVSAMIDEAVKYYLSTN